jgi:hypothetical protein
MAFSRILSVLAGITGALLLPLLGLAAAIALAGDLDAGLGIVFLAMAVNNLWPLGGGMVWQGQFRIRLLRREWTVDAEASSAKRIWAVFALSAVTALPFGATAPLWLLLWKFVGSALVSGRVLMWSGLVLLGVAAIARHRSELPVWRWLEEVEQTTPAVLQERMGLLLRTQQADGAVGSVGGIGAFTVGLHEHLNALEWLAAAKRRGVESPNDSFERGLQFLRSRALASGGFTVYPGGTGRLEMTNRAIVLLGDSLSDEERAKHLDFIKRCEAANRRF